MLKKKSENQKEIKLRIEDEEFLKTLGAFEGIFGSTAKIDLNNAL